MAAGNQSTVSCAVWMPGKATPQQTNKTNKLWTQLFQYLVALTLLQWRDFLRHCCNEFQVLGLGRVAGALGHCELFKSPFTIPGKPTPPAVAALALRWTARAKNACCCGVGGSEPSHNFSWAAAAFGVGIRTSAQTKSLSLSDFSFYK